MTEYVISDDFADTAGTIVMTITRVSKNVGTRFLRNCLMKKPPKIVRIMLPSTIDLNIPESAETFMNNL